MRRRRYEPWKELQLCARVRVDLAVQANFFKSRCGPFHDSPTGPNLDREYSLGYLTRSSNAIQGNHLPLTDSSIWKPLHNLRQTMVLIPVFHIQEPSPPLLYTPF